MKPTASGLPIKHAPKALAALTLLAGLASSLTTLRDMISPTVTIVGTALVALLLIGGVWYMRRYGFPWVTDDGTRIRIRRVRMGAFFPVAGILLGVWLPRFLPPAKPSTVSVAGPVTVVTPVPPTAAPTPLPFQAAAGNETLIVIATFHQTTPESSDAHNRLRRAIAEVIAEAGLERVRVEVEPNIQLTQDDRDKAQTLGEAYNATLIIWGAETRVDVVVNFLNLRDADFAGPQTSIQVVAHPDTFAQVITHDLPTQLSFLSLYAVARSVVADGDYPEGRRLLKLALDEIGDPATLPAGLHWAVVGAYFHLGWLYQQPPENHTLAAEAYSNAIHIKALSQEPAWAAPFNNRGNAYLALGLTNLAILDYSEAVKIDPDYADAYYNRGLAYSELEQFDEAIRDFNEAVRLNSSNVNAYFYLGFAHFELGDYAAAIADYTEVIKLDPENGFAYHNRGTAYFNTTDYKLALSDYEQYLRLVPDADNREDVEQAIVDLRTRLGLP